MGSALGIGSVFFVQKNAGWVTGWAPSSGNPRNGLIWPCLFLTLITVTMFYMLISVEAAARKQLLIASLLCSAQCLPDHRQHKPNLRPKSQVKTNIKKKGPISKLKPRKMAQCPRPTPFLTLNSKSLLILYFRQDQIVGFNLFNFTLIDLFSSVLIKYGYQNSRSFCGINLGFRLSRRSWSCLWLNEDPSRMRATSWLRLLKILHLGEGNVMAARSALPQEFVFDPFPVAPLSLT